MTRHIYVIASEAGPVKIGIATDVPTRLSALKTGSPWPLSLAAAVEVEGSSAERLERSSHEALADRRMTGEWFNCSAEEAIKAVRNAADSLGLHLRDYNAPEKRKKYGAMTKAVSVRFPEPVAAQLEAFCEAKGSASMADAVRSILLERLTHG